MAAGNHSFVLTLRLRKASCTGDLPDIILEELICAGGEKVERNRVKVLNNGNSSVIRSLPFDATVIKSIAFSPPYLGIVLGNGKACRYKIVQRDNDAKESISGTRKKNENSPNVINPNTREENNIVNINLPSNFAAFDDGPKATSSGDKLHSDLSLLGDFQNGPKRQKIQETEGSAESLFPVQGHTLNPSYEQGLERQFSQLIELGLEGGRDKEQNARTENEQPTERFGELLLPVLNDSVLSVLGGSSVGTSSDLMDEGTIPENLQGEQSQSPPMIIEGRGDVQMTSDQFPTFVPTAEIETRGLLSDDDLSNGTDSTHQACVVMPITADVDPISLSNRQNRKRPYEYPPGFRSMSDKLSFMQKPSQASASQTNNVENPKHSFESDNHRSTFAEAQPVSLEWMQSDCKDVQFESITALHSEFLLVSKSDRKLWRWAISRKSTVSVDEKAKPYPAAAFLGLEGEEIKLIDSDLFRVTIVTESGKICSFFDPFISGMNSSHTPNLIKRLTIPARTFKELQNEEIMDVKSGSFYSVALTLSGKVFWWGLAPDRLTKTSKYKKQSQRLAQESTFEIGDIVALKERKEEIGSIVINKNFTNGPLIGRVVKIRDADRSNDSYERKYYTVEILDNGFDCDKSEPFDKHWNSLASSHTDARRLDWSSDEVIFLEERACTFGSVVGLDGNYVVVRPHSKHDALEKRLKVCFKAALTKVCDSSDIRMSSSNEFLINKDRYAHAIRDIPSCVVDPNGSEQQYNGYKAVAVSATKQGLAMLLNRLSNQAAFLVQPEGFQENNSTVFTCNSTNHRTEKEILVSDSNITSEFESVSSKRCMLDVAVEEARESASIRATRQTWKRRDDEIIKAPQLININMHDSLILLDRNACLFPIKFGSCLLQSGTVQSLPFRILKVIEANYDNESKDEVTVTFVAVHASLVLAPSILKNDRKTFDEVLGRIESCFVSRSDESNMPSTSHSDCGQIEEWLSEKYSGNQNILHLCAGNLSPSTDNDKDDVYMLRKLLECKPIRKEVIALLKDKDSLSCTPFLTAVWTNNSQAALVILRAVIKWEHSDPSLFNEAICCTSITGMTPLHHLAFNTSGLQPNLILQNSLIVSNVPSNYSPRMLLQLFKERYASAYRACIPVPSDRWLVKSVFDKLHSDAKSSEELPGTQSKNSAPFPIYATAPQAPSQPRIRLGLLNRADALRASAKQGMVMFSDIAEMNQALAEMDQYPLICKDDSGPGGFTSVARYIIQVHRADDKSPNCPTNQARGEDTNPSRPTRHIIHPALQAGPMRLAGCHLLPDPFSSRSIAYGRHVLPQPLQSTRVFLPRETVYCQTVNTSQANNAKIAATQKPQVTVSNENVKYFKAVVDELLSAHPEILLMVNDQEETALAYYLNGTKRLTNSWIYNLSNRPMPCNEAHCKAESIYNKLNSDFVSSVEIKDERISSLESIMTDATGADLNQTRAVPGISKENIGLVAASGIDALGTNLKANSKKSDIIADRNNRRTDRRSQEIAELVRRVRDQNRMEIDNADSLNSMQSESPVCSTSNIDCEIGESRKPEIAENDGKELNISRHDNVIDEPGFLKGNAGSSTSIPADDIVPANWGPVSTPSQQHVATTSCNSTPTPEYILDSATPQDFLGLALQPTRADVGLNQNERTLADVERLASVVNSSKNQRPFVYKEPSRNAKIGKAGKAGDTSASSEIQNSECVCAISLTRMNKENIRRQVCLLSHLLRSKSSVLCTIFGNVHRGESKLHSPLERGLQQQKSTKRGSQQSRICIEKLDAIVGNLMTNPVPFVVRAFVKTLLQLSSSTADICDILRSCISCTVNPELNLLKLIGHHDAVMGAVEIAAAYRGFLGSAVRQLSLCLSRESNVDPRYCYSIGRYAKLKGKSEEERTLESIRLTLRSFSWLSVIEILKAAETTIKPVRLGISKAQPRGIVSGIQSQGERPQTMQSLLGASPRVSGSNRRSSDSSRSTSHIKIASRRPSDSQSILCPTKLIPSDSVDEEPSPQNRDILETSSVSRDSGHMASNLQRQQGSMSPLAWTLDGHIRVSDMPRGRPLPIPDFLDKGPDPDTVPSIHAGNCYLAQVFSRLVKEAVDLANDLSENDRNSKYCPKLNLCTMDVPDSNAKELMDYAKSILSTTWDWLTEVMNSIENQLKIGEEFDTQRFATRSLRLDPTVSEVPSLGRPPNFSQSYVSKPEEYLMYLLKSGNGDSASDVFPILDLMSYSHVTYILDAYFYMLKKWPYGHLGYCEAQQYQASESYFLSLTSKLFGQNMTDFNAERFMENQSKVLRLARMPCLWLAPHSQDEVPVPKETATENGIREHFKSTWKTTISAFAKLFLAEPPGMERECFLAEHAGPAGRIARFQRALTQLKEDCLPKNINEESRPFTASIRRQRFLTDSLKCLMSVHQVDNHPYSSLNIRFEGEEGTGPGVNRGFFTGFANALTGDGGTRHSAFLYQPGQLPEQAGIFATKRISTHPREECYKFVFTAIGRFLGLVLWFNQAVPITFTRPILKFLLNKEDEITFEDLAYHNSTLYSSYSQMILDANSSSISEEAFQNIYCCDFQVTIDQVAHELIPNGSKVKVTKSNALEMVSLASLHIMVEYARSDLEYLRSGLHQIIPKKLLQPLSAEDFQLLLSGGIGDIDLSRLKSIIRFNNARNSSRESIERFKGWFWSIVRDMTPIQRMKLLYFLTGSAVLPAYDNKIGNNEEIAVTVDIVGQSSTSLPVASTCGQRLSIPLYDSRKELRRKLLIAIECETYNLG